MGENTPELISPIIFTYRSLFTKQNTIDPEDTENYWVKMLPKNRCLRNTAQHEGAKGAVRHWGNSSACWTSRCSCSFVAAPFSLRECLFPGRQCKSGKYLCQVTICHIWEWAPLSLLGMTSTEEEQNNLVFTGRSLLVGKKIRTNVKSNTETKAAMMEWGEMINNKLRNNSAGP